MKLVFALLSLAVAGTTFAAEPAKQTTPAVQVQTQPQAAPAQLTPEAFEKIKAQLLELHADRLKVLTEGERCIKATKGQADLQKCIDAERAALMPKPAPVKAAPAAAK